MTCERLKVHYSSTSCKNWAASPFYYYCLFAIQIVIYVCMYVCTDYIGMYKGEGPRPLPSQIHVQGVVDSLSQSVLLSRSLGGCERGAG